MENHWWIAICYDSCQNMQCTKNNFSLAPDQLRDVFFWWIVNCALYHQNSPTTYTLLWLQYVWECFFLVAMDWTCSVLWLPGFLWSSYVISWKLRGKVHHLIAGFPPSHFLQTWLVSKADLHLLSWWPLSTSGGKAAASWSMSARLSLPLMCSYLSLKEGSLFCFVL
jgi:hypothetical protein